MAHRARLGGTLAVVMSLGTVTLVAAPPTDEGTGVFRVEQRDGVWWFVDPQGQLFLSKGVDTVQWAQDRIQGTDRAPYAEACAKKYGSRAKWREAAARRLLSWGFNSLGAWSDDELAKVDVSGLRLTRSPILNLGSRFVSERSKGTDAWLHGVFPDVFDPEFSVSGGFEAVRGDRTASGRFVTLAVTGPSAAPATVACASCPTLRTHTPGPRAGIPCGVPNLPPRRGGNGSSYRTRRS